MLTAIILAAGEARRMGSLKQLLPWENGLTVLETVVQTVLVCPEVDDEVRVVLGAERDRIAAVLAKVSDPRLCIVHNPQYNKGMLSSIKCGIADLPAASRGFMIFLGDQPLIQPDLVTALARHWQQTMPDFLLPVYQGRRGHPVLVNSRYAEEILGMDDAEGGLRQLIRSCQERVRVLDVQTPSIHIDLDYPEDYRQYRPGGGNRV